MGARQVQKTKVNKSLRNIRKADQIFWEAITHDDGVEARGGIAAEFTGEMGSGKSTMLVQVAESVKHAPPGKDRRAGTFNNQLLPETVIWRGRGLDHWNVMIPERFEESFPNSNPKPLRVFVHYESEFRFFEKYSEKRFYLDSVDVILYAEPRDIYDNIVTGGINVVYEPAHYELPPEMVNELLADQLKPLFPVSECPSKPAPSPIWWFEFIRFLIENKDRYEFFTIMLDEAHEVIPASSKGELWHLINKFGSQTVIEMRKKNISFFPASHRLNLIDYRVNQRMNYFFWFPGSMPPTGYSRVKKCIVQNLHDGQVIVERAQRHFGYMSFGRIPKQPPIVQVEGMKRIY